MAVARPVDLVAHRQRLADLGGDGWRLDGAPRGLAGGARYAQATQLFSIKHISTVPVLNSVEASLKPEVAGELAETPSSTRGRGDDGTSWRARGERRLKGCDAGLE